MSQMYNSSNAANYTKGLLGLKSEIMVTSKAINENVAMTLVINFKEKKCLNVNQI